MELTGDCEFPGSFLFTSRKKRTIKSLKVADTIIEQVYTDALSGSTHSRDNINDRNERGYTALMLAVERENLQVLSALLEAGADVNVSRSSDGSYTALSLAVDKGHTTAVRELLQHGAFLSCEKGIEALDMARENGFLDAVAKGEDYLIGLNKEQTINGKTAVFQAFKNNRFDLVKDLIRAGSYVTLMHESTYSFQQNNKFLLQQLIDDGINVNVVFKDKTALTFAIINNSPTCVDILLKSQININLANGNKWTALHFAASRDKKIVKMLIEAGASVNAETCDGETPLHLAANAGNKISYTLTAICGSVNSWDEHRYSELTEYTKQTIKLKDICTYLLEAGANLNLPNRFGIQPIVNVLAFGSLELMKLFIEKGADVNACDSNTNSLLSLSISSQNTEIANLLVAEGADVDFMFNEEVPVLIIAVQLSDVELVKNMLAMGADIEKTDKNGDTPLHAALHKRHFYQSLKPSLEFLKNVSAVHSRGRLLKAEKHHRYLKESNFIIEEKSKFDNDKSSELLKILIEAGSNVNKVNNKSESPLHLAVENKLCLEILIKSGADVNLANENNQTPLHLAASGPAKIVEMLIGAGADVNARIKRSLSPKESGSDGGVNLKKTYSPTFHTRGSYIDGSTALHIAALTGNINTMKRIVSAGGSVNAVDINGDSVLHKAIESKDIDKITYLIEAGANINIESSVIKDLDSVELSKLFEKGAGTVSSYDSLLARKQSIQLAVQAVENNADVNFYYNRQVPFLVKAVRSDDVELVRTMVKHGADVTKTDKNGNTPLHIALLIGARFERSLKYPDYKIDERNYNLLTVQHHRNSVMVNRSEIAEILINAGSNVNQKNNDLQSPLQIVVNAKYNNAFINAEIRDQTKSIKNIIENLLKHGAEFDTSMLNNYLFQGRTSYANVFLKYKANPSVEKNVRFLLINNQVYKLESIFSEESFEYLRMLLYNGIVLCSESKKISGTVITFTSLMLSIKYKCIAAAKFLLASSYMTVQDLTQLRHFDKSPADLENFLSAKENLPISLIHELRTLIHEVVSQPWPLSKLAFITVSTMLGEGPERDERLAQIHLPHDLKQLLMFQTPFSLLPVSEWPKMKIRFDHLERTCLQHIQNFWPFDVLYSQLRHKLQLLRNYTENRSNKFSLHHRRHLTEDVLKAAFDLRGRCIRLNKDEIQELEPLVEECISSIDACIYYHGNTFNVDKGPHYLVLRSGLQFMVQDFELLQLEYSEGYSEFTENVDFFTERLKNWQESFGTFCFYENVTHRDEDLRKPDGIPDDHIWWFPTEI